MRGSDARRQDPALCERERDNGRREKGGEDRSANLSPKGSRARLAPKPFRMLASYYVLIYADVSYGAARIIRIKLYNLSDNMNI